jgi:hypothetical protein
VRPPRCSTIAHQAAAEAGVTAVVTAAAAATGAAATATATAAVAAAALAAPAADAMQAYEYAATLPDGSRLTVRALKPEWMVSRLAGWRGCLISSYTWC